MKKLCLSILLLMCSYCASAASFMASSLGVRYKDAICVNCITNPHINAYYLPSSPNMVDSSYHPMMITWEIGLAIYILGFLAIIWGINQNVEPQYNFKKEEWDRKNFKQTVAISFAMMFTFLVILLMGSYLTQQEHKKQNEFDTFKTYVNTHIPELAQHNAHVINNYYYIVDGHIFFKENQTYYEVLTKEQDTDGYSQIRHIN